MTSNHASRPWYCPDAFVDDYLAVAEGGGDLQMLKTIKAIQSLIANIGVIVVGVIAIRAGGDPTWVGGAAIVTLGLLNGVLAVDYAAVARAVLEIANSPAAGPDKENSQ